MFGCRYIDTPRKIHFRSALDLELPSLTGVNVESYSGPHQTSKSPLSLSSGMSLGAQSPDEKPPYGLRSKLRHVSHRGPPDDHIFFSPRNTISRTRLRKNSMTQKYLVPPRLVSESYMSRLFNEFGHLN